MYFVSLDKIKEQVTNSKFKKINKKIIGMRKMLWWREEFRDISTRFYYIIRVYTIEFAKELVKEKVLNEIDFKLQNKSSEIQNAEKIENRFPSLLVYPDKLVPEYKLRELYYGINNIDINTPILKKIPENKKN